MFAMFKASDVRSLVKTFPIRTTVPEESRPNVNFTKLSLIPNASGNRFITSEHLSAKLRDTIENGKGKLSINDLAYEFDVTKENIIQIAQEESKDIIWNRNQDFIYTKKENQAVADYVCKLATNQLVTEEAILRDIDVAPGSLSALIEVGNELLRDQEGSVLQFFSESNTKSARRLVYSDAYRTKIAERLKDQFLSASQEGRMSNIDKLESAIFVKQIAQETAENLNITDRGEVIEKWQGISTCKLIFVPQTYLDSQWETFVNGLSDGSIRFINIDDIPKRRIHEQRDLEAIKHALIQETNSNVSFMDLSSTTIISLTWYNQELTTAEQQLFGEGNPGYYRMPTDLPEEVMEGIQSRLLRDLQARRQNQPNYTTEENNDDTREVKLVQNDTNTLLQVQAYIVTQHAVDEGRQVLQSLLNDHLRSSWYSPTGINSTDEYIFSKDLLHNILQGTRDIEANSSVVVDAATSDALEGLRNEFLTALLNLPELIDDIKERHDGIMQTIYQDVETEFASFWLERITAKVQLYSDGLCFIQDAKLKDQLTELLRSHIILELVPENVERAKARGYLRVKKITKDTDKLVANVKDMPTSGSLDDLRKALEKFEAKRNIQKLDAASLEVEKHAKISDLEANMQKDKDGPRLFLTVILILFAKHRNGLIYATGKFAPRILKQLKGTISEEMFARLEDLKEKAKKAALTNADKEGMKQMAAES
jgi:hypothetical protein